MSKMKKSFTKFLTQHVYLLAGIFVLLFGFVGITFLMFGSAAYSHSPLGYIDYCQREGDRTVLYGWAHDPDAAAGSLPRVTIRVSNGPTITASTNVSGYRDSPINKFLSDRGIPRSRTYGFRVDLGSLYKGKTYGLSGTIIDVGQGSNSALIPHSSPSGPLINGKPNFPSNRIPEACLVTRPPAFVPSPTTPSPTKPSKTTPTKLSTRADASLTIGSLVTNARIPNGNADKIRIVYGTEKDSLGFSTETKNVGSKNTTLTLTELEPSTTYYYRIIRLRKDDTSARSEVVDFATKGFDVVLVVKNGEAIAGGVTAAIDSLAVTGTTDENGTVTLKQVPEGVYSMTFTQADKQVQREVVVSISSVQPEALSSPVVAQVTTEIQLEEPAQAPVETPPPAPKKSPIPFIALGIAVLGLIGGVAFWLLRRHSSSNDEFSYPASDFTPMPPPVPPAGVPQAPSPPTPQIHNPPAPHPGESLKDLVIESMREEAAQKQGEHPPQSPQDPNSPPPAPH